MFRRTSAIISICFLVSLCLAGPFKIVSIGDAGIFKGYSGFNMGPLADIIEITEDEKYDSRYFTVLGELELNLFSSDADWLSTRFTDPLVLDTTDIEARWSFDRGDARDDSGNGHDGEVNGAVSVNGVYNVGQSMFFDGDDYITVPHSPALDITQEITVEAWIYPTFTDSGEHMIISKGGSWGDDDSQDYELTMDRDRPLFQIKLPASNDWYGAAPDSPIVKNTWHHIAGVYDGTRFMIYIDGFNQTKLFTGWDSNYKGAFYTGGLPVGEYDISIGRRAPASWGSLFFKGNIDEVRIFDKALDPETILEHAAKPGDGCINITGTPGNDDVGTYNVVLNLTDSDARYAQREFTLTVLNRAPVILTENIPQATQDVPYSVDYSADDEGQGITGWELRTDATWLKMNQMTGILSGTPTKDDVGTFSVNITFNDGHGGKAYTEFSLTVENVNDPPEITSSDLLRIDQDELYNVQYFALDPDPDDILTWNAETDAEWLSMDTATGVLSGTPENDDVGIYSVNVSVTDTGSLFDFSTFQLEVQNINDRPVWIDVPMNTSIDEGQVYTYDVNATDVDVDDEVTYWIMSYPEANISINSTTGVITWKATREPFTEEPYQLNVQVRITDGEEMVSHNFNIDLKLNPSPYSTLASPANGSVVTGTNTTLSWEGYDPGDEAIAFDVYLSTVLTKVEELTEDARITEGIETSSLEVDDLEAGETYYWAVVPVDEFSRGTWTDGPFSFYVNTPPQTSKLAPVSGTKVSTREVELSWDGKDADGHDLLYDVYLSEVEEDVTGLMETALKGDDITEERLFIDDLLPGKTYYWVVIPHDGHTRGPCIGGPIFLNTNTPPALAPVPELQAEAGKLFTYQFVGQDADEGDIEGLTFSLRNSLEGMTLSVPGTGDGKNILSWTPTNDQVGGHTIMVVVTDGIDETNITFTVQVMKSKEDTNGEDKDTLSPLVFVLPGVGILLIVIFVVILLLVLRSRKKKNEGPEGNEETIEEAGSIPPDTDLPPPEAAMESGTLAETGMPMMEGAVSPGQPTTQPQVQTPVKIGEQQNMPPPIEETPSNPPVEEVGQNMTEQNV